MINLVFIAIWNRLMNWGLKPIIVTRTVAADGDVLRRFLSDPANQWRLASRFADARGLSPTAGAATRSCASRSVHACTRACT